MKAGAVCSCDDTMHEFLDGSDGDRVDMILESPRAGFKGDLEQGTRQPLRRLPQSRVLGTLGVVAITYLYMCGGPIGSEPVMVAGGPLIGLSSMIVYPLLVVVPYAYIVTELCTAFPEDGGFSVWVLNAFGAFWGFQVGFWSWICGVIRSAMLPGVLVQLAVAFFDLRIGSALHMYLIKVAIALVLAAPTLLGTINVSRLSVLLMLCVMLPFLVFSVWSFSTAKDADDLLEVRHEYVHYREATKDVESAGGLDIQWTLLLNTLFWKFDGTYMASVFGGEVWNPARTFSRAILLAVLLTVLTYLVPLPAAIVSDHLSWLEFDRNAYPTLAMKVGGETLHILVFISSVAATIGMFIAGVYMKAFQVSGMATLHLVPPVLAERNGRFAAPTSAVLLTTGLVVALVGVDFDQLLPTSNAFAAAVELAIIATAMRLRSTLPDVPRPTRVPGGLRGMALCGVAPVAMLGYVLIYTFSSSLLVFGGTIGLVVVGLLYGVWLTSEDR